MYFIYCEYNYFFKTFEGLGCFLKVLDGILPIILSGLKKSSERNYETGSCKRSAEVKIQLPILGDATRKEKRGHGEVLMPGDR